MLLKSSASPDHPFSKFGCGNYETLTQGGKIVNSTSSEGIGSLPVADLVQFWKTYYQTYNLRLCVVGQASLDAIQKAVENTFGTLPKSEGKPRRQSAREEQMFKLENAQYDGVAAFDSKQLGKIRHIKPIVESRQIKLMFATPPIDDALIKKCKPYRVLSHLLGHEAPGSLHSVLDEEGLLIGLTSGTGLSISDFSLFALTISLTPKGMQQYERVLDLSFQWIAMIRDALESQNGLMQSYHDELRDISNMNFRFRESGDPTEFCSSAADLMFESDNPPSDILFRSSEAGEYDPVVTKAFLDRFSPENSLINVISSDWKEEDAWEIEKWYGAKYQMFDMTEEQKSKWLTPSECDERLQLPGLNKYIPTDFSVRCDDGLEDKIKSNATTPPEVLIEKDNFRMWHKMDR